MNDTYHVGDWVVSNDRPRWGPGQVVHVTTIRHTDGTDGPFLEVQFSGRERTFHLEPDEVTRVR